jgi:hypothetical protein
MEIDISVESASSFFREDISWLSCLMSGESTEVTQMVGHVKMKPVDQYVY